MKVIADGVAFVVAEALDHDLLEGLGGDSAELVGPDVERLAVAQQVHLAADRVHRAGELLGIDRVVELSGCGNHRLFQIADEQRAFDVSISCDGVEDADHFL